MSDTSPGQETTMNRTGYDSAAAIPPGTVIEAVYFAVPTMYTPGDRHDTYEAALAQAVEDKTAAAEKSKAANNGRNYVGETVYVDTRWVMKHPDGGGQDTIMARDTYDTLAEARATLARRVVLAQRYPA